MAPLEAGVSLLSADAPSDFGQALPGIWSQQANCVPGYSAPACPAVGDGKALLSTSVLKGGEARARFPSGASARTMSGDLTGGTESEAQPYRPGEVLKYVAKLPRGTDSGAPTPERAVRADSEGSGSGSDSEGTMVELRPSGDASRELLGAPSVGSQGMPTVGSLGHWMGTCKPCAFAFKGCQNGAACHFCHLCLPGEKQRRRKLSKLATKEMWLQMQQ
mmetsp:Transcript_108153/g.316234  ORF Transcript_108153/g.316234 Transcript_108153/m.316234 type:complete len:219 (-) Transcript_108153:135-791(-)